MFAKRAAFLFATLVAASVDAATRVRVIAVHPDGAPAPVVVRVRHGDQLQTIRVALDTEFEVANESKVEVIEPVSAWSPIVNVSDTPAEIPLWPAAELKGRITVEKGQTVPAELEATFDLQRERVTVRCRVVSNEWTCRLPATKLDVRLAAKEFAPRYFWDVALSHEHPLTIAPFVLKRGGSVAGWIAGPRPDVELERATVKLAPRSYGDAGDTSLLSFHAKPNRRGFFQFTGIPAGQWVVLVEAPDFSPSAIAEVETDVRNESMLRDALQLRDLADLRVSIKPEVYARGVLWRVRLNRRDPRSPYQQRVGESTATEAGEWTHARIAAGDYDVEIVDARGAVYATRRIAVGPEMQPIEIEIGRVPVKGEVTIGGSGVAAHLKFSARRGENLTTTSNERGEFRIQLPFEGVWGVEVRLVASGQVLTSPDVKIARSEDEPYTRVHIDLAGGRIAGRVVDPSGKPVEAGVILTRNGSLLADILAVNGAFELLGVTPGPAMIEAQAKAASSGTVPVMIHTHSSQVTLTVRSFVKFEGFLLTPSGDSVAGASIHYREPAAAFIGKVVTSPTGRFVINLAANTSAIAVAIAAPGLPSKLALLRVPEDGQAVDGGHGELGRTADRAASRFNAAVADDRLQRCVGERASPRRAAFRPKHDAGMGYEGWNGDRSRARPVHHLRDACAFGRLCHSRRHCRRHHHRRYAPPSIHRSEGDAMKTLVISVVLLFATAARPGWFGLGFTHHMQDDEQWLVVRAVAPGGPAAKAGLALGDVVTAINGKPIRFKDTVALLEAVGTIGPNERVRFQVIRGGRKLTLTLTTAPMSDAQFERWKANLEIERRAALAPPR